MGNITENCKGCNKIDKDENCLVYPNPVAQMRWVEGGTSLGCSFNRSSHVKDEGSQVKTRVGQQKQKKR
jgi:hypothetical protein